MILVFNIHGHISSVFTSCLWKCTEVNNENQRPVIPMAHDRVTLHHLADDNRYHVDAYVPDCKLRSAALIELPGLSTSVASERVCFGSPSPASELHTDVASQGNIDPVINMYHALTL